MVAIHHPLWNEGEHGAFVSLDIKLIILKQVSGSKTPALLA
jgi:hypothetical protein